MLVNFTSSGEQLKLEIMTPGTNACNCTIDVCLDFYGLAVPFMQTLHYQPHSRIAGDEPSVAVRYNLEGVIVEVYVDPDILVRRQEEEEASPWMNLRDADPEELDRSLAEAEGWGVFENADEEMAILRVDEAARFKNDDEARGFVKSLAAAGSAYHRMALEYVRRANDERPPVTTPPVDGGPTVTATVDVNVALPPGFDMDDIDLITFDIPLDRIAVHGVAGVIPGAQATGYTTQTIYDDAEESADD